MTTVNCPHCGADAEFSEDQVGAVVHCPNPQCGKPFQVTVPAALAVPNSNGGATANSSAFSAAERVSRVIHPAMRGQPLLLAAALTLTIGGFALALATYAGFLPVALELRGWAGLAGLIAGAAGVLWLAIWRLILQFQTLTITTERTLLEEGFIARRTSEVRHDDVRNLQIHQSVSQRLLNVGDLAISSAGQEDFEIVLTGIPNPTGAAELIRAGQ